LEAVQKYKFFYTHIDLFQRKKFPCLYNDLLVSVQTQILISARNGCKILKNVFSNNALGLLPQVKFSYRISTFKYWLLLLQNLKINGWGCLSWVQGRQMIQRLGAPKTFSTSKAGTNLTSMMSYPSISYYRVFRITVD
jgi:hypothetical protein